MSQYGHFVQSTRKEAEAWIRRLVDGDEPAKQGKRRRILEAASREFLRHGYRRASVDAVAQAAHVSKGTVYLYFGSKAELLVGAIALEKMAFAQRMLEILDGLHDPVERFVRWFSTALVAGTELPLVSKLMQGDRELLVALEELSPSMADRMITLRQRFVGEMLGHGMDESAARDGLFEDRVKVLIGVLSWGALLGDERIRQGLPVQRFADVLADIVAHGLWNKNGQLTSKEPQGNEP